MFANTTRPIVYSSIGLVRAFAISIALLATMSGCVFVPDIKHKPQFHNPFPQISKVAVLPFRNQSQEPTLSGARVSMAYYNELQSIRGFEVVPYGVVENQLAYFESQVLRHPMMSPVDFQQFAKYLGVDAVLQGAITDYEAYYPPRMTLKVSWYAANPGFHPIPVGYGLPWGTKKEKKIPEWIRLESERALAAEQMKTQSPEESSNETSDASQNDAKVQPKQNSEREDRVAASRNSLPLPANQEAHDEQKTKSKLVSANTSNEPAKLPRSVTDKTDKPESVRGDSEEVNGELVEKESLKVTAGMSSDLQGEPSSTSSGANELPANWPDPQGFIPRSPTAQPPKNRVQFEPIISYMRTYNGNDEDFTQALGEYFYFRDDTRFGGWQAYLQRSEDFIRFCCYQHIVETLASRGGQLESRMILRWPINRYER